MCHLPNINLDANMNVFPQIKATSLSIFLTVILFVAPAQATLVVDFSPDTTGATLKTNNWTNLYGNQILGDQFTLLSDTTLTGGSIFSRSGLGAIGNSVRFMIFSDPTAVALIDIITTLDAIDTQLTVTQTTLTRKHASIADTFLGAGTYWFALAGNGVNIEAKSGDFGSGGMNFGTTKLQNTGSTLGDLFFTLDGPQASPPQTSVPEPGSLSLLGLGLVAMFVRRRNKV